MQPAPLLNGGCSPPVVCSNTVGGRTCGGCPAGYVGTGVTCEDVDECAAANGGCDSLTTCANTAGARTCSACPSGYKGSGETRCNKQSACASNNGGALQLHPPGHPVVFAVDPTLALSAWK